MSFYRKVLVLKQLEKGFCLGDKNLSGIVNVEIECGVTTLFLSLVNFKAITSGEYYFALIDDNGKLFSFPLPNRPTSLQKVISAQIGVGSNFQVGIFYLLGDLPLLIAFGADSDLAVSQSYMRKKIAEKCLADKKEKNLDKKDEYTPFDRYNFINPLEYDDEAVASENYFELDSDITNKIKLLEEKNYERLRNEDVAFTSSNQEQTQTYQATNCCNEDETDARRFEKYSDENPYYNYAKKELTDIFSKFEEEKSLLALFPESKWAKIHYSSEKYYVVGVINEKKKPKYICYGVPSNYSKTPPPELDGYCSFVPLSVFDVNGKGYFMMYQDAITGKHVEKYKP